MPERQQQLLAILLLAGLAGAVLFMSMRQPLPPPPGGDGTGTGPPLTPEQIAAMRNGGARARAVPFYQNEERWEMRRDTAGHLKEIVVHRDARVMK